MLQQHSDLLSDTADQLLESYILDQTGSTRKTAEVRLAFLRRCREVGIEQGVAELQAGEIPPELDSILQEISTPAGPEAMPGRIRLCEQALQSVSREGNPSLWARLQFFLGDCWSQNVQADRAANIERAITAYNRSLEISDSASHALRMGGFHEASWDGLRRKDSRQSSSKRRACY